MIKVFSYYRTYSEFVPSIVLEDPVEYWKTVRKFLKEYNVLEVVLEPGDATHYDFVIIDGNRSYMLMRPEHCYCMEVAKGCDFVDVGNINPWTGALIRQIFVEIQGVGEQSYDWEKARPVS